MNRDKKFIYNKHGYGCNHNLYISYVEAAVGNSLTIEKGVILTGSNMSGKSTFLRAVGEGKCFCRDFSLYV